MCPAYFNKISAQNKRHFCLLLNNDLKYLLNIALGKEVDKYLKALFNI